MKRELTDQEKESLLKTAIDHPTFIDELSAYQKSELIELIQVKLQWIDKSVNKLMLSNPGKNGPDYWRARLSKGVFTYNNLIEVQASILDQYRKRELEENKPDDGGNEAEEIQYKHNFHKSPWKKHIDDIVESYNAYKESENMSVSARRAIREFAEKVKRDPNNVMSESVVKHWAGDVKK